MVWRGCVLHVHLSLGCDNIAVIYAGICFRCYQVRMFGARAIQRRRDKEAELKVSDETSHAWARVAEIITMNRIK